VLAAAGCGQKLKAALVFSRQLTRKIDLSDNTPVQSPKSNVFRAENKIGNGAAPLLAEEALAHVVGGYIGETEKNLHWRASRPLN
jgi:hypothetical protein